MGIGSGVTSGETICGVVAESGDRAVRIGRLRLVVWGVTAAQLRHLWRTEAKAPSPRKTTLEWRCSWRRLSPSRVYVQGEKIQHEAKNNSGEQVSQLRYQRFIAKSSSYESTEKHFRDDEHRRKGNERAEVL